VGGSSEVASRLKSSVIYSLVLVGLSGGRSTHKPPGIHVDTNEEVYVSENFSFVIKVE
jgi:hypothetical protein